MILYQNIKNGTKNLKTKKNIYGKVGILMKKRLSKLSAMLLSVILVISSLSPFAVFADENDYDSSIVFEGAVIGGNVVFHELAGIEFQEFAEELEADPVDYIDVELDDEIGAVSAFTPFRTPVADFQADIDVANIMSRQGTSADYLLNAERAPDMSRSNAGIMPFNTNPNLAININGLFGLELNDLANNQQRWYHFNVPANSKITSVLSYQGGVYDLMLFRLNGSTLEPVAQSIVGNGSERLAYITPSAGTYFLAVAPFVPAPTPHLFTFVVEVTNGDQYELNDFFHQATVFNNSINIQANLDSRFDEDWFRLNVTTAKTKDITVSNAPAGNHYAVFLYDSNLNTVGSFYINGSATRRVDFAVGHYFIRILSLSGHHTTANYSLRVQDFVPPPPERQPIDSFRMEDFLKDSFVGKDLVTIYPLKRNFPIEAGGIFEVTVTINRTDSNRGRLWLTATAGEGRSYWGTQLSFVEGTHTVTEVIPHRIISIPGMPAYEDGSVNIELIAEGDMWVTMSVKSLSRPR